ncbi:MAG: LysR family transcriptional regulator [Pseudomonadota bacterium]
MKWDALKYDWSHVRAFLATAEEGSLSAAAVVLGLTQPTLGRQISAFEESLGVTLFERAGRQLRLTQAGRALLEPAQNMRDAALGLSLGAAGHSDTIDGQILITATEFVASHTLPPILSDLRRVAPALSVTVIASNDVQDLTRREADISIRHARPEQPELVARKVAERHAGLYAAVEFLDRFGRPKTLTDVEQADFVGIENTDRMMSILASFGLNVRPENIRVSSESGAVIAQCVRAGLGYSVMTDDMAHVTGGLEAVLPDVFRVTVPTWLVTHSELRTSAKLRLVFDHLVTGLHGAKVLA